MKELKGLAHIAIFTKDMQESICFYEALGGIVKQRDSVQKVTGVNQLAIVALAGFQLELIEPHDGTEICACAGAIPHIAIEVADLLEAVSAVRAKGIHTFLTEKPNVLPDVFGGVQNWFFTGPSGEQIELLQKL